MPATASSSSALGRNFTIVGAATLASRLTGFVRDMLVAAVLGAGAVADAYVAAFLIPNLFRRLIGEGAFNAAFVPIFMRREAEGGRASAQRFAESALSLLVGFGLGLLLAGEWLMPWIIGAVAPGFGAGTPKFMDAVAFGRIVFPFVAVILVVAVFTGTLNALGRYAIAAWAPVLLNLMLIGALLYCLAMDLRGSRQAGFILVGTVLFAGIVNLAIVGAAVALSGFAVLPRLARPDADLRRLMLIALPGIAVVGSGPVNMVVAAQLSSATPSAVSWLYFADRIFQLPLGFVVAAVGVVLLPAVSRHLAGGDEASAQAAESRALEFGLLVALPAAMGLMLLAKPIVGILFERGAFTAEDTRAVAAVLRALAAGLPAFVLVKVFLPSFLAREDMQGPIIAALLGIAANIALALALQPQLGSQAAAVGVAASAVVNACVLFLLLRRRARFSLDSLARRRLPRVLLASALTGLAIWLMGSLALPWMKADHAFVIRAGVLALVCATAVALQLALAQALQATDIMQIRRTIRA
jgi:putative peptidoglycan lipid II flippase